MHKNSNIVIFMPSIEGGGVEKNLFLITNFLSQKFKKLTLITCSRNIKNFNKKIKIINFIKNLGKINFRLLKIIISSLFLFIYFFKNKNVIVLSFQANIFAILIGFLLGRKVVVRLNSSPSGWLKKDITSQRLCIARRGDADSLLLIHHIWGDRRRCSEGCTKVYKCRHVIY